MADRERADLCSFYHDTLRPLLLCLVSYEVNQVILVETLTGVLGDIRSKVLAAALSIVK